MNPVDINVQSESRPIVDYCRDMERGEIIVNREYQRSTKIWPIAAQSYLIESILLGYPIPKLTLRQVTDIKTRESFREIVDGQQRSEAIRDFFNDRLRLSDKVDTEDFRGRLLSELDDAYQGRFLNYGLAVDVFVAVADQEVRETFRRMNSYMVPLNPEEQRHAEFQGPFKWFIHRIAKRYGSHFTTSGLFKERALLRMQDMKLLTEVCHAYFNGIQTTNKTQLAALYRRFEVKFATEDQLEQRLDNALDQLFEWKTIPDTELMKPYMIYALVLAIMHVQDPIEALTDQFPPAGLSKSAEENLSVLGDDFANKDEEVELQFDAFVQASIKSTNTRANRLCRFRYFYAAMTGSLDAAES